MKKLPTLGFSFLSAFVTLYVTLFISIYSPQLFAYLKALFIYFNILP